MIKAFILTLTLMCNLFCYEAFARERVQVEKSSSLDIEYLEQLSHAHDVPLWVLLGVLSAEKGKVGEAFQNNNGTWDLGAYQINTIHINEIVKMGIDPFAVLSDAKVNANIAAYILSQHLAQNKDIWKAIGTYHSRTPHIQARYIESVKAHVKALQRGNNAVDDLLNYVNS